MKTPKILIALPLALLLAGPAHAQEETAAPVEAEENPLVTEARGLVATIEGNVGERKALEDELGRAKGEDRLVIQGRMGRMEDDILESVDALVLNLLAQEEAGLEDAAALRQAAEEYASRVTIGLQNLAERSEADVTALGAKRETLEPERQLAFEARLADHNARVDRYFEALVKHADRLEALGLDATPVREYLVRELGERADSLDGRVELAIKQIADLTRQSQHSPEDVALKMKLRAVERKLEWTTGSLAAASQVLQELGQETASHRQLLIRATGEITGDIFDSQVALGLAGEWLNSTKDWGFRRGPDFLFKLLLFGLIILAARLLSKVSRGVVRRGLDASNFDVSKLLHEMIISLTGGAVLALGILIGLSQLGIQIGPLLTGIGIAGFIVGFALQDTLANFASGAMILLYRPYDEGDVIEAGGVMGKVSRMSLVSTTFLTFDHQTLVVPNSKIWGDVIKNVTAERIRRVDMKFKTAYDSDVEKTEAVLASILKEHPKVLADPEPLVKLHELNDSSLDFIVRPWVHTGDYWDVYWSVTREVKMRFDREGISIPFPQRDVHLIPAPDAGKRGSMD